MGDFELPAGDNDGPLPQAKEQKGLKKRPAAAAADAGPVKKRPAAADAGTVKKRPAAADAGPVKKRPAAADGGPVKKRPDAAEPQSLVGTSSGQAKLRQLGSKTPRCLELFSGTGSVGDAFKKAGWYVVSLDLSDSGGCTPDIFMDILKWDFIGSGFPVSFFDVIWASPPCTEYSRARTTAKTPRNLSLADSLVEQTFAIINHFKPKFWFMENPHSGMLAQRPFMHGLDYKTVDYCQYDGPHRKRTAIWGDRPEEWVSRGLCQPQTCPACEDGKHVRQAQRGDGWSVHELHRIPASLTGAIAAACTANIRKQQKPAVSN